MLDFFQPHRYYKKVLTKTKGRKSVIATPQTIVLLNDSHRVGYSADHLVGSFNLGLVTSSNKRTQGPFLLLCIL